MNDTTCESGSTVFSHKKVSLLSSGCMTHFMTNFTGHDTPQPVDRSHSSSLPAPAKALYIHCGSNEGREAFWQIPLMNTPPCKLDTPVCRLGEKNRRHRDRKYERMCLCVYVCVCVCVGNRHTHREKISHKVFNDSLNLRCVRQVYTPS